MKTTQTVWIIQFGKPYWHEMARSTSEENAQLDLAFYLRNKPFETWRIIKQTIIQEEVPANPVFEAIK